MASRFPPFAFVELVSPYNKKNITRWLEDMNFMFSWQEQYLTRSLRSLVRYCSCHSNIKFISSRHRVISSISSPFYPTWRQWGERKVPCRANFRNIYMARNDRQTCQRLLVSGWHVWITTEQISLKKSTTRWKLYLNPVNRHRRGSRGGEMGEFSPPFFWVPFFLFFP